MDGSVYDVFISFRGIDTRSGFTGSLHRALCGKQIKSFMDDHNLEKGAEINPALEKAIQASRIALVILSKNYASSTFCLDELEKIMDCSKDKGMLVLPVFYEVEPSDVRYQKGEYADAMNKHEARIIDEKEKIEKWRFALTKISYLFGWNLKLYRYEYKLIDTIVEHITKRIHKLRDDEKEKRICNVDEKHVTKHNNVENLVTDLTPHKSLIEEINDARTSGSLRVFVVDDDHTYLMILHRMLRACLYEVTKCSRAEVALSILRENKNMFDIVLCNVHMPDMDGFKLLEHIRLEMDLPVIMMSADDGKQIVMKGVTHGACDYLIKPVRMEALKNIWQHVVRRRKNGLKDLEQSGSVDEGDRQVKASDDVDYSSSANEGKSSKKRRDEEEDPDERDDSSTLKKPRVVWSVELHQQFMAAVNQLGLDKAVPKKILESMNVPGLTRENVASHLEKYRRYFRRLSGVSPQQNSFNHAHHVWD